MPTSEHFHLSEALDQLVPLAAGKRAMTLIKTDQLRLVLVRMTTGGEMHEHIAPGQITIHPINGQFDVTVAGKISTLTVDTILTIDAHVSHSVRCSEDGAFLLTIAWNPLQSSNADIQSA